MSTAKRLGLPRYLRRPAMNKPKLPLPVEPVLVRTVAFLPAYQRKRLH
jgi:hypothetical protein